MAWKNILRKGDAWEMEQAYGMRGDQIVDMFSSEGSGNNGVEYFQLEVWSYEDELDYPLTGEDISGLYYKPFNSDEEAIAWAEKTWKELDENVKNSEWMKNTWGYDMSQGEDLLQRVTQAGSWYHLTDQDGWTVKHNKR
tara:strand:+ start:48 stop:464 length:417 start_codon:yes stop_codon:yes gene_type:complete